MLNLDSLPSKDALDEVSLAEGITSARVIQLPEAGQLPEWLQA